MMEIALKKYYITIKSKTATSLLSILLGWGKSGVKAVYIFPGIIFLRFRNHPMNDQWLNHELIHHRQMIESFGIAWIISVGEYLYARTILGKSHLESYLYQTIEQEAYDNQANFDYLETRRFWAFWKYIKEKPVKLIPR